MTPTATIHNILFLKIHCLRIDRLPSSQKIDR